MSERHSNGRYEAIRRELDGRATMGTTVLDFGAYAAYFSIRLAEDFGARCLAVDDYHGLPAGVLITQNGGRVHGYRTRMNQAQFENLEARDVTLLLSVLHHLPWWREALAVSLRRSKVVFVELADPAEDLPGAVSHHESAAMHEAVQRAGGIVIEYTPGYDPAYSRPLYVIGRLGS